MSKHPSPFYTTSKKFYLVQKIPVDLHDYWNPEVYIDNVVGEAKRTSFISVEYDANGQAYIIEKRRVKGAFMETMELWEFPFDVQVYFLVVFFVIMN